MNLLYQLPSRLIVSPRLAGGAPCLCSLYDTRLYKDPGSPLHHHTTMHLFYYLPNFNQLQSAHAGMVLHIVILRRCTFDTRVIREDPNCFGRGRMGLLIWFSFCREENERTLCKQRLFHAFMHFDLFDGSSPWVGDATSISIRMQTHTKEKIRKKKENYYY